ncbi:MAG TPA: tRNA (guanosine(37)-N1)-methyltransferase TrmD [Rugosimonospora sp.]|nr:tRNA (guanosine(37)-N1)-methyltransferase TrmD [Rugosimonospora sp.]
MKIDIVTIFPEYLAPLSLSLIGRARAAGLVEVGVHDLRGWTSDVHRTVDDTPYGGGPGMVMRPEPWGEALDALAPTLGHGPYARRPPARLVVPSPAGTPFDQAMAKTLAAEPHLIFACGRYEGIDQRVLDWAATRMPVDEVSLGDYVLFGGEVAVLVILEAVVRLLPGVLGNADSLVEESHADGVLEAPVYTKPPEWRGLAVPEVLRSGDHGRIARWRREQGLARTAARRPDLLTKHERSCQGETGFQVQRPDVAK